MPVRVSVHFVCVGKKQTLSPQHGLKRMLLVSSNHAGTQLGPNRQIKTRKGTRRWRTIKSEEMAQSLQQMTGTGTVCGERLSSALSSGASFDCPPIAWKGDDAIDGHADLQTDNGF